MNETVTDGIYRKYFNINARWNHRTFLTVELISRPDQSKVYSYLLQFNQSINRLKTNKQKNISVEFFCNHEILLLTQNIFTYFILSICLVWKKTKTNDL